MNEYTAEIAIRPHRRLSQGAISDAAELGGVAVARVGGRRLEATLTVQAADAPTAAEAAIVRLAGRVPGDVIAVEVMTTAEQDRRLRADR